MAEPTVPILEFRNVGKTYEVGTGRVEAATKPDGVGEKFFRSLGWKRDEARVTRSGESYVVFYRLL